MLNLAEKVPGYADLVKFWNGEFPTFHDSEVLSLWLDRTGVSRLSLRLLGRRGNDRAAEWTPSGYGVVTFLLEEVDDLELQGFSHQNVISGLMLSGGESAYRIELDPCFGLSGWLVAKQVRIEFQSGDAT